MRCMSGGFRWISPRRRLNVLAACLLLMSRRRPGAFVLRKIATSIVLGEDCCECCLAAILFASQSSYVFVTVLMASLRWMVCKLDYDSICPIRIKWPCWRLPEAAILAWI